MTKESCSKTTSEQHSDLYGDLNDGCSSTLTLDSFITDSKVDLLSLLRLKDKKIKSSTDELESCETKLAQTNKQLENQSQLHKEREQEWIRKLEAGQEKARQLKDKRKTSKENLSKAQQEFKEMQQRVSDLATENQQLTLDKNCQLEAKRQSRKEFKIWKKDLKQKMAAMQGRLDAMTEENGRLMDDKNFLNGTKHQLEREVEQITNALESTKRKTANQRKIHDDMVNRSNELEDENEQQKAALDVVNAELVTVRAERDAARTQINNLRLYTGALQHLVNQFQRRLQDSEHREQNEQALRDDLLEILDGLQNHRQPNGPTDIFALRVEAEVHIPD